LTLTSPANARIKAAAALHRRKYRDRDGRFLAEGPGPVVVAYRDGVVEALYATPDGATRLPSDIDVTLVTDDVLAKISDAVTPQGVVAVCTKRLHTLSDVLGTGYCIVLHGIADPGNAGTVVRTADAFGAAGVVFASGSVDPWSPKAVRAAAGSTTHVRLVVDVEPDEVLEACRSSAIRTVALDARGVVPIDAPGATTAPCALIVGSEAHGLPAAVLERVDVVCRVPRFGRAESLNLAAATAVAAYVTARGMHGRVDHGAGGLDQV
jgi:TrmH family RNA methyltransferase